jgi:type III pantothenate kinase
MTGLFESGNSRLHFGWWNGETVIDARHLDYPSTPDGLVPLVHRLLRDEPPERIMACSVSPKYRTALFTALEACAPGKIHIVRTAADLGIRVRYDHPERYGADRALAVLAAYHRFRDSCVVIGAGTAVTVDAVDSCGNVAGGFIVPGAGLMAWALAARTGLPEAPLIEPDGQLGASTETCIARGIANGLEGAVNRLREVAAEAVGSGSRIIVTGGGGKRLFRTLPEGAEYRPELTLEGLGLASRLFAIR